MYITVPRKAIVYIGRGIIFVGELFAGIATWCACGSKVSSGQELANSQANRDITTSES